MIDLNTLWFILVAVLFCGFFFLEGIDFGVGMLSQILGKTDTEKRLIINSIGPIWNSNEVWLLTAGGALFAAFPGWYATMFSGLYLALFLVLVALIIRGVAFEFRSKVDNEKWRKAWDICLFLGSFLPPLLIAVAMANLIKGLPIDKATEFTGNFFDLLSLPTLAAGIAAIAVFLYHGAVFLSLKLEGDLKDRAVKFAHGAGIASMVNAGIIAVFAALSTDMFSRIVPVVCAMIGAVGLLASVVFLRKNRPGIAMIANAVAILGGGAALFAGLFPRVMVSSIDPSFSLTIYSVSSTPYTLKVMTIIALSLLPIVLGYLAWTYWTFRERVTVKDLEY